MARLSIGPTAVPTPEIAAKIETWHATAQPTAPPIVVPVAPLDFRASLRSWLAMKWPTLFDAQLSIVPEVVTLVEQGYAPAPGPVEDWAALEARGWFEMGRARAGVMGGASSIPRERFLATIKQGPVAEFSALVIQARGKNAMTAKIMAYAVRQWPDWYLGMLE